jgi:aldehyde dehydrogenase (NAD+)
VVVVPSSRHPLSATDLYQVFDTSDLPGGVVNIVTGSRDDLAGTLAGHDEVSALWDHASVQHRMAVEKAAAGNLKAVWATGGRSRDWFSDDLAQGQEFLRNATQIKTIWIPYGE